MAGTGLDRLRQWMGYQFPPLGPIAFKMFVRFNRGKKITSRFFHNLFVPIDFADIIQTAAYWRGSRYERPTPQIIGRLINENKLTTFFDIGANFGFFSYYIKSAYPSLQIYSFEPGPANYNKMVEVKRQNNLNGFDPQNIGLGDSNGILSFNLTSGDSGHSTFGDNPLYANNPSFITEIKVQVMEFDAWRQQQGIELPGMPQWIAKIDVEGFELKVLHGMKESIKAGAFKAVCIEINTHTLDFFKVRSSEIFDFFAAHGYKAFDEDFQGTQPLPSPDMRNVFFILN